MELKYERVEGRSAQYYLVVAVLAALAVAGVAVTWYASVKGLWVTGMTNRIPWGMQIVMAVYYIGFSEGCLVVAGLFGVFGKVQYKPFVRMAVYLAMLFLIAGLLSILTDQGRMDRVFIETFIHVNPSSMFSINPVLYLGHILICIIFLFALFKEKEKMTRVVATLAFAWAFCVHSGTGAIFGFGARVLYESPMLPATFARIASYELAFKMQSEAPEAIDIDSEPEETKQLYGIDQPRTEDFGRKCLLARRLVERGVRFIQIYSGGAHNDSNWDAHGDLEKNHNYHAGNTDKAIAGLIKDLKRRGMLDETLIVWGGEFGRQPTAEYAKGTGRDHNSYGFTMWMAGGGVKGGTSYGATDELGGAAVENRLHVRNLHATILSLMGFDPNDLSFFYNGLDQRLVGVKGAEPIVDIMA